MAESTQNLKVIIDAEDRASTKMASLSKSVQKVGISFAAIGGAITAAFGIAVKAAAESEVEMAKFNTTMADSAKGTAENKAKLLESAEAARKLGFDYEDSANSLAKFFQRTGDAATATKLNTVAMDLARAKSIDLGTATTLVNQVLSGNGKVLKQYGIDIKETASPLEALGQLQTQVKGQTEAFANTLTGKTEIMNNQIKEFKESIGAILIPIISQLLTKITPVIEKMVAWAEAHPAVTKAIVMVVAGLGALLTVVGLVMTAITTLTPVFAAFGVVFAAINWPITLIVLGIAAITAAVIYLHKHWSTIWPEIKKIANDAWDGIKTAWEKVGQFFSKIGDDIKNIFTGVHDFVMGILQPIIDKVNSVINLVKSVSNKASSGVSATVNFIKGKAEGGPVSANTPYVVGEQGPELFVPTGAGTIVPHGTGGGVNVYITGNQISNEMDLRHIADAVSREIVSNLQLNQRLSI